MNSFDYLYYSEWERFYNLIMWLKHGRIHRECFIKDWGEHQERVRARHERERRQSEYVCRKWRLLQEGREKK